MLDFVSRAFLRIYSLGMLAKSARRFVETYPVEEIALKAKYGREAVFPFTGIQGYARALLGADISERNPTRFQTLDNLILMPPLFSHLRFGKKMELQREPLFSDVETESQIGGFKSKFPLSVASMGLTRVADVANASCLLSSGAAKCGIPMGFGGDIVVNAGYSKRKRSAQPCWKERAMEYLENIDGGYGGIIVQQSAEDAVEQLWESVYSDPDMKPYIEKGLVTFEIRVGQGARPGLGTTSMVSKEVALSSKGRFYLPDDPNQVSKEQYERHGASSTWLPETLIGQIRSIRSNYPKVHIFIKTGPYRDLAELVEIGSSERVDGIVVDGKEGGTSMSPFLAMKELGLPTIACLKKISEQREKGINLPMILSGRLYDGSHIVKSMALGASAIAMGRPFLVALKVGGVKGILNFVEAVGTEARLLASALGKYNLSLLSKEDMGSLDKNLADSLGVRYVYAED